MLDFALLQTVNPSSRSRLQERQTTARRHFADGLTRFERAQDSDFRDREALVAANQSFSKAIEADPLFLAPYLSLAQLLALYGIKHEALACLGIALTIQPTSQQAQSLKAYIENLVRPESPSGAYGANISDHDLLYENLRFEIETRVRQIDGQAQALRWFGIPSQNNLNALHQFCWQLAQDYRDLGQRISALDTAIETSELFLRAGVIEKQLCQLKQRLQTGQRFLELQTNLEAESTRIEALLLHAGPEARDAALENLLDRCDRFAEQLARLDAQGHDILVLKPAYKLLSQRLELLQEAIEDSDTAR